MRKIVYDKLLVLTSALADVDNAIDDLFKLGYDIDIKSVVGIDKMEFSITRRKADELLQPVKSVSRP